MALSMPPSGLLISWAMPAESRPTAARRSDSITSPFSASFSRNSFTMRLKALPTWPISSRDSSTSISSSSGMRSATCAMLLASVTMGTAKRCAQYQLAGISTAITSRVTRAARWAMAR